MNNEFTRQNLKISETLKVLANIEMSIHDLKKDFVL